MTTKKKNKGLQSKRSMCKTQKKSDVKQLESTIIDESQIASDFDRDIQKLTFAFLKAGGNPGIAQHILVTDAMQMGFAMGEEAYLAAIGTALSSILGEIDKRVPTHQCEGEEDATKH